MGRITTCDLCREPIAGDHINAASVRVIAFGRNVQREYHQGRNGEPDCIARVLARFLQAERMTEGGAQSQEDQRMRSLEDQWRMRSFKRQTTPREREHLVLGLFGEGARLTRAEARRQLEQELPQYDVHTSEVAGAMDRLMACGDLGREKEPFHNRYRWRYFRRAELEGPIADLQRALDEDPS